MDKDNTDSEAFLLLQPELLTERELKDILISRCVSRNLGTYSKSELVELFRNVALPLPQREYTGTSWREKKWRKIQQRTKRTISISHNYSSSSKSEPDRKVPRLSNESSSSSSNSPRLKPPPDMINYDKKVIKLTDTSKSKSKSTLDTVVIKSKSKEPNEKSLTIENKKANGKQAFSSKSEKSSSVIKLKRDSSSSKDEKSDEANKEETSKKKRQKIVISW